MTLVPEGKLRDKHSGKELNDTYTGVSRYRETLQEYKARMAKVGGGRGQ